jgi:hypothetical protein
VILLHQAARSNPFPWYIDMLAQTLEFYSQATELKKHNKPIKP